VFIQEPSSPVCVEATSLNPSAAVYPTLLLPAECPFPLCSSMRTSIWSAFFKFAFTILFSSPLFPLIFPQHYRCYVTPPPWYISFGFPYRVTLIFFFSVLAHTLDSPPSRLEEGIFAQTASLSWSRRPFLFSLFVPPI